MPILANWFVWILFTFNQFSNCFSHEQPNFLIIVADDLGWSDLSPFGGEIKTPNLQMLADSGTRFTDFHTASACSPTRAMLMSGTDHHIAGLGQMAETVALFPHIWQGRVGYEGYLNDRVAALPEILHDAGYFTTMSGKWHLGLSADRFPASRGFEDSFALLSGGGNHFNDEAPIPSIWPIYARNFEFVNWTSLGRFYSSDYFATQLMDSLEKNVRTDNRPFFAYLPFTAPHWPLQAPSDLIANYKGMYEEGPDVLREKRLKSQKDLGLVSPDTIPSPISTNTPQWDEMSPTERNFSAKTMQIYAAMVEGVDRAIGRVLDYLKKSDQFENTFILFLSDNGAEGGITTNLSILSLPYFNNSYENIGNSDSLVSYGPRWAQASTAPSRLNKGHITEGGIRCPAIVHFPKFNQSLNISHEFATVLDILPTILELANVSHPGTSFRNRTIVRPKGVSWVSHLQNPEKHIHDVHNEQDFVGWELFGEQAIRQGNYKAILIPTESNTSQWELYNLTWDKGETMNVADVEEDVLKKLLAAWSIYLNETGVILAEDGWAVRYPSEFSDVPTAQMTTTNPPQGTGHARLVSSFTLFLCLLISM